MNDLDVLERQLGPGLRRTLDTVLAPDRINVPSRRVAGRQTGWTRHRLVGLTTAAALAARIAGTAIVLANRSPDSSTPAETRAEPLDTTNGGPFPGTAPLDGAGTGADASTNVAAAGIHLPALPIEGFTPNRISVERSAVARQDHQVDRYLRTGADGARAMLAVSTQPASEDAIDDDSGSISVHGVAAHIFDSGDGVVVQWTEAGTSIGLRGIGIDWNDMAAYAEASVVAADRSVAVPGLAADGFTLARSETPPPESAVTTLVELVPDDHAAGLFVSIAVRPNDELLTIDVFEVEARSNPAMQLERTAIGKTPALVQTSPADQFGTMTTLSWLRNGMQLTVVSRLPRDQVIAIAESLAPATLADARALADDIQATLGALPEIDRATLPNGFEVSVHTSGTGGNAICLRVPFAHCEPVTGESSILGEEQSRAVVPIVVGGTTWQVGWAVGSHQPVWAEGLDDTGPVTDIAQGTAGTFVAFTSTSESAGVRFDPGTFPIYQATDPMLGYSHMDDLLVDRRPPATTT